MPSSSLNECAEAEGTAVDGMWHSAAVATSLGHSHAPPQKQPIPSIEHISLTQSEHKRGCVSDAAHEALRCGIMGHHVNLPFV
ncbi:hypothetical protein M422DRAFT_259770 [Sphaerobolus stellatus SS14]|uniref:Uncharacterized protein n=1 Tax=Sphaerobolus stellatus (strain SS14) TaxID=990650 RepID=A0A0C9U404_SPHS4|nr:hypothetical protein M422DRAFT_259770 [Sphaerobolus stellatus SS14]